MKCPTLNCPNILPVHSRRLYCARCRQSMAYHAKKRPAELLEYISRQTKSIYRVEHIAERKLDQQEALSQLRRTKRAKHKPIRSNGARAQL